MRACILVLALAAGCSVPDSWRTDRLPGPIIGTWRATPEVVLHTSLTEAQKQFVIAELESMGPCRHFVREMRESENAELATRGMLLGRVLVTGWPPLRPGTGTAEVNTVKGEIVYSEVRIRRWNRKTLRHELMHAIAGVGHNTGGPDMLMYPGDTGLKLLPEEAKRFCK